MIVINKSTTNECVFTLLEKQTIDEPTYLFVFTNDQTKRQKAFIAAVTESNDRYQEFDIIENSTESLYNGTVSLDAGMWTYKVYEQTSTTNLNPDLATTLLEEGKVRVVGTQRTVKRYNGTRTAKAYVG